MLLMVESVTVGAAPAAVANADVSAVRDLGTALGAVAFKERTFLE